MVARECIVKLTNRKAALSCDYSVCDEINEILKFRQPDWKYTFAGRQYAEQQAARPAKERDEDEEGEELWDGYYRPVRNRSLGAGLFLAMQDKLAQKLGLKFVIEDKRKYPEFTNKQLTFSDKHEERKYQVECQHEMVRSKNGGLILNATGTGKTYIAGKYFSVLKGSGLFLVDELQLLKQAKKEIEEVLGEEVGEIGNSVFEIRRITVATIQTIHRHRFDDDYVPWTRQLDCIIIDEIHLALNRRNFETVRAIKPPVVFGLTATLELKKKHVAMRAYDLCGPVLYQYPLKQGEAEGVLSKGVAVAVKVDNEHQMEQPKGKMHWWMKRKFYLKRYPEDYQSLIVEGRLRNKTIRSLVETAHARGKYTVVLVERVQHLEDLSKTLKVPHHLVYGERLVQDRLDSTALFESGKVRVILANKVFKKGINIKRLDLIIDAAAMKSKNDAQQKYGRGVRLCAEKEGLIYIDIADVGNRFEKAAKSRRTALKRIGIPVFLTSSSIGATRILDLAEKKLRQVVGEKKQGSLF